MIISHHEAALLTRLIKIIGSYHITALWTHVVHLTLTCPDHDAFLRLIEFRAPTNHVASLRAHIVLTASHNIASLRACVIHYLDHWLFPYHVASLGACPVKTLQIIFGSNDGATLWLRYFIHIVYSFYLHVALLRWNVVFNKWSVVFLLWIFIWKFIIIIVF